jgi:hypothetical protein
MLRSCYSANEYGLTVRRRRMTSTIYVPFRFFSTLRPRLLFNFEEANLGRYTYVAAPIGSRVTVIRRTSLPRFTFSSDLLIADPKR